MSMQTSTNNRLIAILGYPHSQTEKVNRWSVTDDFDVVSENRGNDGKVWLTARSTRPTCAEFYPSGRGRNSNTYAAPTLAKGKSALCCNVRSQTDLEDVIAHVTNELQQCRAETLLPCPA